MPIDLGERAPDFSLRDQNNEIVTLAQFHGQRAVFIVFYPFAFTSTCTGELIALRDAPEYFAADDVQVLTISVDSPFAHKAFSLREGFEYPLLADFWPHGAVAQSYGVFNESAGIANRGTFLIDVDGVVRFAEMNSPGKPRDPAVWMAQIDALRAGQN